MKKMLLKILYAVLVLLTCTAAQAQEGSLVSRLISQIDSIWLFANDSTVCSQEFDFMGEANHMYFVSVLTEWGHSCNRTCRMFLFDKNEAYIGQYYLHGIMPFSITEGQMYLHDEITHIFKDGAPRSVNSENIIMQLED